MNAGKKVAPGKSTSPIETPVLDALSELAFGQPSSIKSIADFLLLEGSGVERMSMGEVAATAYTSKPTLVRFAKQLGFSGWPEFRIAFLREALAAEEAAAREAKVDINYPFAADDSPIAAAEAVLRVHELAAEQVRTQLTDELLASAATTVMESASVALFGRPPGWYYGSTFAFNLNAIGKSVWIPHAEEADLAVHLLGADSCVVAVSYSGTLAKEPFSYVERARGRGAKVLAVTSVGSPLAQVADVALTFAPLERYYDKVTGFYSCACMELYLDALFSACYLQHYGDYAKARAARAGRLAALTNISDDLTTR